MRLRLFLSVLCGVITATLMGVVSTGLLSYLQEYRILDYTQRSIQVGRQINAVSGVKEFLLEHKQALTEAETETILFGLIDGDPFIHELSLLDTFGKMRVRVEQALEEENQPVKRATPALRELMATGTPTFTEESGEYFIPLSDETSRWGVLRVRWRQEAMENHLAALRTMLMYSSILISCIVALFVFIGVQQTYTKQLKRLGRSIRSLSGTDTSQRLTIQGFSSEFTDIGVYLNRLLRDVEEEKKKGHVLDDTLRQVERNYIQTRKQLEARTKEFDAMRTEMREGIRELLESMWCGVVLLDSEFRMHFSNDASDRMMRFVEREGNRITDPSLRTALAPLIETSVVDRIDDICAWPQPGAERTASCRIRAARIPTADSSPLYYLIMREEGGQPMAATSAYFSERMVLDVLTNQALDQDTVHLSTSETHQRMQECLRRIVQLHEWEIAPLGAVSQIHLTNWLSESMSEHPLRICPSDDEVQVQVNEGALYELSEAMFCLIQKGRQITKPNAHSEVRIRTSKDHQSNPVCEWILSSINRRDVGWIQSAIDDRIDSYALSEMTEPLDRLEIEIAVSMIRQLRQLLHLSVEYVYSENKKLFTIRLIFPRQANRRPATPIQAGGAAPDAVSNLMRTYLNYS